MAGAEAGTGSGTAPCSVPPAATPAAAAARVMSSVSAAIVTVAAEETFSCLRLNGDVIAAPPAGRWVTLALILDRPPTLATAVALRARRISTTLTAMIQSVKISIGRPAQSEPRSALPARPPTANATDNAAAAQPSHPGKGGRTNRYQRKGGQHRG